ncbi:gp58-like family protein, partial [Ligilactobacillus ruminis]
SDGIGLKVAQLVGGSDISKIDMTSAAVKIDSKHILLNGDVAIDGTTFAKKIKATGITADMMLAGTIDAAKINVINIDASKITTGTLTAVEMHQSSAGADTWINKDGIHNQMGSNNVWIKRGTLATFDSSGQGMFMEQGRLTLASYAYWQNNLKLESINYGVIKCDDDITGKKGIGIIGKGGFNVRTDNSTLDGWTGNELWGGAKAGAGIIGTDDGKLILGSSKPTFIEGGWNFKGYDGFNHIPFVQVGGEMAQTGASLDKNGSSVVISAWDIKLNACGPNNRNIILNRLTYNGEHTINLNDSTSDLWWGPKMHAPSFVNTSALSKKMNITKLDTQTAINAIKNTDIYDYQFKEFGETGKHYASLIIDDVNDKPQYKAAGAFVDGGGRDDGTQLGYLTVVVQNLLNRIERIEENA